MKIFRMNVRMRPMPKQSFRFARNGHHYQPAHVSAYENALRWEIQQAMEKQRFPMIRGPVAVLRMLFCFSAPSGLPAAAKRHLHDNRSSLILKPTRPDFDNLEKAFWDAAKGLLIEDDSQVAIHQGLCGTFHSFYDRIEVAVHEAVSCALAPGDLEGVCRAIELGMDSGEGSVPGLFWDPATKRYRMEKP